jgi:hypothetical protein
MPLHFPPGYAHIPPWWAKVMIVSDIIMQERHSSSKQAYQRVMWMDTDAVVWDLNRKIDSVGTGKSFVAAR